MSTVKTKSEQVVQDAAAHGSIREGIGFTRWTSVTVGITLLALAVVVLLNIWIDVFGLFWRKDATVYQLDRYSYHLLSDRYIPTHFNEIMFGSSLTDNWDTSLISNHRIFNYSAGGSNLHEQVLIARHVLETVQLHAIYILLYPSMMDEATLPTAYGSDKDRYSAFGSEQNALIYAQILWEKVSARFHHGSQAAHRYYPYGGHFVRMPYVQKRPPRPADFWTIDQKDLADLQQLISLSRKNGTHVYFVIPPLYAPQYEGSKPQFDAFFKNMETIAGPDVAVIDLLHDPATDSLRHMRENYPDMLHPDPKVIPFLMQVMGQQIEARHR